MYKTVSFIGAVNERTGYGIHASRFIEQLSKLMEVKVNVGAIEGAVHISLIDSVSIQNINSRLPSPSILYNVWESTEQPQWFMERLQYFDQLWVPSEWQRAASIAQGVPEEFVKVVPEGVDPEMYKPDPFKPPDQEGAFFSFLHVGQWQPRKSTREIIEAFLNAFPDTTEIRYPNLANANGNVRLYLSVDTLYPSDKLNSTEERLAHYGLNDSRIIPVHFEERDAYIRRLQSAHCFVSCSRSEGWGLPIIEAMACGIPTIVADWSGSTEYAYNAIRVPVKQLIKPFGIYGDWVVPGQWCEPDFDRLTEIMRHVYTNYSNWKDDALEESKKIRNLFSWGAAAHIAMDIINEIPAPAVIAPTVLLALPPAPQVLPPDQPAVDNEAEVHAFARAHGFKISAMAPEKIIFNVDAHPDSPEKIACLLETIEQIKGLGFLILLTTHYPIPPEVQSKVDFFIYDKRDINSGDDRPIYWRVKDGVKETVKSGIPCHALAAGMNVRNGIDFCIGKFDWIYIMSSDTEVDLSLWLKMVQASSKDLIGCRWEDQQNTFGGQMVAGRTEIMDRIYHKHTTWAEFVAEHGDERFNSEQTFLRRVDKLVGPENYDIIDIPLGNRFNQVDKNAWADDIFSCNFIEGPFLNISGVSDRVYDVTWGNPIDGDHAYDVQQKCGVWSRPSKKFYRDWTVTARLNGEIKYQHHLTLKNQNVIIAIGSKALGDTIAWIPYIEEFRKKHECNVYLSTWWNRILDYPEMHMITPGSVVENCYATYSIGCFDDQPDLNPINWRTIPLQKVAADQLGIEYQPMKTRLKYESYIGAVGDKPYICFSEFSTMQNKLWNNEGAWQKVIDYLKRLGYDCVSISAEETKLSGVVSHCGQSIEQTLTDLSGAQFYVGLNAGPSWLAIMMDLPVVMITGVSEEWNDYPNKYRVASDVCRPGCFNDPTLPIDRGWAWCPRKKDFACTKAIIPEMVIETIDTLRKEKGYASKLKKVRRISEIKHEGNDGNHTSAKAVRAGID